MTLERFNKQKLRNKLLIIYIVGFLVPIISINTIFSYNIYIEQMEFQQQNFETNLEKAMILIENRIDYTLQVIYSVYVNRDLYTFLESDYNTIGEYMKSRERAFYILNQLRLRDNVFKIYTDNTIIHSDPIITQIDNKILTEDWYVESIKKGKGAHLYFNKKSPDSISIIRALDYNIHKDYRWSNIIKSDIPLDQLKDEINKISMDYGIALISDNDEVVLSNNRITSNYISVPLEFDKKLLTGWKLVGRIPKKSFFQTIIKNSKLRLALPQFLIALLGSFLIFTLSRSFYKRIYQLSKKMKSIEEGNFNPIEIGENHSDEITQLSISYNIMINRIHDLIHEVSESKLREKNIELVKNKAQLSALRSQINPHYLFNVLESIRMRSVIKKEKETAGIIKHLSKSFRHIISWEHDMVSIEKELEIVNDFLVVQKYRFGDKLNYEFNVDRDCYNVFIPKLTLQPFIENSCIHGIEKSSQEGKIVVQIYKEKSNLVCRIKDNGIGISSEKLNELNKALEDFNLDSSHIGFSNTYWRLKKYYSNFELIIDSEEGSGTTVQLSIPLQSEEQKND